MERLPDADESEDPHALWQQNHDVTEQQTAIFDYLLTHTWDEAMTAFEIRPRATIRRCV